MRDARTDNPETATCDKALIIMQGLGYEALRARNPQAITAIKKLIA